MSASTIPSNLARLSFHRAERDPHGPCISDDPSTLDNAGFAAAVQRLGDPLSSLGVVPGDTVAVLLPNCSEIVTPMFRAWARGAALTPINPTLTDAEVRYQLEDSMTKVVVGDERAGGRARAAGAHWVDVRHVHSPPGDGPPASEPVASMSDFA